MEAREWWDECQYERPFSWTDIPPWGVARFGDNVTISAFCLPCGWWSRPIPTNVAPALVLDIHLTRAEHKAIMGYPDSSVGWPPAALNDDHQSDEASDTKKQRKNRHH